MQLGVALHCYIFISINERKKLRITFLTVAGAPLIDDYRTGKAYPGRFTKTGFIFVGQPASDADSSEQMCVDTTFGYSFFRHQLINTDSFDELLKEKGNLIQCFANYSSSLNLILT